MAQTDRAEALHRRAQPRDAWGLGILVASLLWLAACATGGSGRAPLTTAAPQPSPTLVRTVHLTATPVPGPRFTVTSVPSVQPSPPASAPLQERTPSPTFAPPTIAGPPSATATVSGTVGQVIVFAEGLDQPDDLATGADGSIYLSDVGDGTVRKFGPDGRMTILIEHLSEPEGIVVLPGNVLIIAEQGKNRLVRYDPASGQVSEFLRLENKTGNAGVDGIVLDARDPANTSLVIPDSPNGTILRCSIDGKHVEQIGHGFVRPVAAWIEQNGDILVADEYGNALKRLRPDGTVRAIVSLPVPDDVIADGAGHIYVNTLHDSAIHVIDAATGADSILVRGLASPQGITFDKNGDLVATDPGHHRLIRIVLQAPGR